MGLYEIMCAKLLKIEKHYRILKTVSFDQINNRILATKKNRLLHKQVAIYEPYGNHKPKTYNRYTKN